MLKVKQTHKYYFAVMAAAALAVVTPDVAHANGGILTMGDQLETRSVL